MTTVNYFIVIVLPIRIKKRPPLYKEIVEKTILFLQRNFKLMMEGFYAALDADSLDQNNRLTEGAFYVWTQKELTALGLFEQEHFCSLFWY